MPSASVSPAHGMSVPLMRLYIDGIELGLDADHLDRLVRRACATVAMPEISPPPPIGIDERVDRRHVLEHLERDRALAGDDARIVERMDEGEAALRLELARMGIGGVERLAVQDDVAPWPSVWVTFTVGVLRGITIVAGMPSRCA